MSLLKLLRLPNGEGLTLPAYATPGAAGMDICAAEDINIPPQMREFALWSETPTNVKLVRTGFACELEPGFELQVRSRSGLALKHGVGRRQRRRHHR